MKNTVEESRKTQQPVPWTTISGPMPDNVVRVVPTLPGAPSLPDLSSKSICVMEAIPKQDNAHLIAASPELLEACKALLMNSCPPLGHEKGDRYNAACELARAAILKATTP